MYEQIGENGLRLYCYSEETVYNRLWNPITLIARGLIIDIEKKEIVATPFPKFFNVGEVSDGLVYDYFGYKNSVPDLPFETFEKLDGSLIIIFFHNGKWQCATKGSFKSDQAIWASGWLTDTAKCLLEEGTTYLAEAIYPENRIVVDYSHMESGLYLLGAYDKEGKEILYVELEELGFKSSLGITEIHQYGSISELLEKAKLLDHNSEGWVLRFSDGTRIKIKGDEYCRIHRMVSNLTPLTVWKVMRGRISPDEFLVAENLEDMRKALPEEFWEDFDKIRDILNKKISSLVESILAHANKAAHLTDKEVGLNLLSFPEEIRKFIFAARKGTLLTGRTRHTLFEAIRPDRNVLEGYRSSGSVNRVQESIRE